MHDLYQSDLAYIHDSGFDHLATNAAPFLLDELKSAGVVKRRIVELGCGSGITSRLLANAGYSISGLDISEPLIKMARERVPDADFRVGSFVMADIPPCIAVTAIGEIFNYAVEVGNRHNMLADLFGRIYTSLQPGGLLLFDMSGLDRIPAALPHRKFQEGRNWAVLVEEDVDHTRTILTRHITSFRGIDDELYRRSSETHQLHLVQPETVMALLEDTGYTVTMSDSYGILTLPAGLTAFLARKPR